MLEVSEAEAETQTTAEFEPTTLLEGDLSRIGLAMGTAGYMPPERVRGEKLDARTDLFSFGLVLYETATGQRAFSGQTPEMVHNAILRQVPVKIRDLNAEIPSRLEAIIGAAMEKIAIVAVSQRPRCGPTFYACSATQIPGGWQYNRKFLPSQK